MSQTLQGFENFLRLRHIPATNQSNQRYQYYYIIAHRRINVQMLANYFGMDGRILAANVNS